MKSYSFLDNDRYEIRVPLAFCPRRIRLPLLLGKEWKQVSSGCVATEAGNSRRRCVCQDPEWALFSTCFEELRKHGSLLRRLCPVTNLGSLSGRRPHFNGADRSPHRSITRKLRISPAVNPSSVLFKCENPFRLRASFLSGESECGDRESSA